MDYTNIENEEKTVCKKKYVYTVFDGVMSIASFILGFLFVKWVMTPGSGAGAFVFTILLIAASLVYLKANGIRVTPVSAAFIAVTLIFSSVFLISSNDFIKGLTAAYVVFSSPYWFFSTCANAGRGEKFINDIFAPQMLKAVFAAPFAAFGKIFGALSVFFKKGGAAAKRALHVALGLLITILPTYIIIALLNNISAEFASVMRNVINFIYSSIFADFISNLLQFTFLGIPVAIYIYGVLFANAKNLAPELLNRAHSESLISSLRFMPQLIAVSAAAPIILIYTIFFAVQFTYFSSAFAGALPPGFSYAEYARQGFFELCGVSLINFIIILCISVLTRKNNNEKNGGIVPKILILIFSAYTLLLIATAISKMALYIKAYGMTPLRVYTSWFMLLLAAVFIIIIIKQFSAKLNSFAAVFVIFAVMFGTLIFCDADAVIVNYNIKSYLSGGHETFDVNMAATELSDSAAPYLLPVLDKVTEGYDKEYIKNIKELMYSRAKDKTQFPKFNFSSYRAYRSMLP